MGIFINARRDMVHVEVSGKRNVTASGVQRVIVEGKDWGPAITKVLIELNDYELQPGTFDASYFTVVETAMQITNKRDIVDAYVCDENGHEVNHASKYIALVMWVSPEVGNPMHFNPQTISGEWHTAYSLDTRLVKEISIDEHLTLTTMFLNKKVSLTSIYSRVTPEVNQFKFESNDTYHYAYFVPKTQKDSYPLVIWLHGGGEGGTDLYKCILGNKVVSLIKDDFQNCFDGAYILVPQAKTYWMEGYGTFDSKLQFTPSGKNSDYTESLMALIQDFAGKHPIDPNRIIVGGCSNGGYMALQLMVDYPNYFAAGYPICEGMLDSSITDEQINALAASKTGVYFIYSMDDPVFNHKELTSIPTYNRLKKAGGNVHVSQFNEIVETYLDQKGEEYTHQYSGHFSWVKFFANECEGVFEALSQEKKL